MKIRYTLFRNRVLGSNPGKSNRVCKRVYFYKGSFYIRDKHGSHEHLLCTGIEDTMLMRLSRTTLKCYLLKFPKNLIFMPFDFIMDYSKTYANFVSILRPFCL